MIDANFRSMGNSHAQMEEQNSQLRSAITELEQTLDRYMPQWQGLDAHAYTDIRKRWEESIRQANFILHSHGQTLVANARTLTNASAANRDGFESIRFGG